MRLMLTIRDGLSKFYGEHDTLIRWVLKFILALTVFWSIRAALGQMAVLNSPLILLCLSVACTFLPSNAIILVGAGLIMAHFYGISLEAALVGGGCLLIAMLLYFSIAPESALPLLFTALLTAPGFSCAPALVFGLLSGPLGAVGVAFGAMSSGLVKTVAQSGGSLTSTATEASEAMVQRMAQLIEAIFSNTEMFILMAACAAAFLVVYILRTRAIKYAWTVGMIAGVIVYLLVRILLSSSAGVEIQPAALILEAAVSLLAAWIAKVMLFQLDYKKTESVRFEDDDYFYYVKAVPKQKIRRTKRRRQSERR